MKSFKTANSLLSLTFLLLGVALRDDGEVRPEGGIVDGRDALYGAAIRRMQQGYDGYIYRLTYDGADFKSIHDFKDSWPDSPPAIAQDGRLFGTTRRGGEYDAGTIFSMNRDGSNFQTLYSYRHAIENPGVAPVPGGLIAAVSGGPSSDLAIAVLEGAHVKVLHQFLHPAWVRQLRTYGASAYGVVQQISACGSELFRVDRGGYHNIAGTSVARGTPACGKQHFYFSSAMLHGVLYAQEARSILRVTGSHITPLYNLALPESDELSPPSNFSFLPGISPSVNSLVALTTADDQSSCGSVLSVGPDGKTNVLHIFPPNLCAWHDLTANLMAVSTSGTLYAVQPPYLECGQQNPQIPERAKSCGRVVAVENSTFRVLHEFRTPAAPQPQSTRPPVAQLSASARIGEFFLTKVRYGSSPVMSTPSPQPMSLHAIGGTQVIPLVVTSPTATSAPMRPDIQGPALLYRAAERPQGAYILFADGKNLFQRLYFPQQPIEIPTLSLGQQFIALPGLPKQPALDRDGRTFGTEPLTVIFLSNSRSSLRAADGRIVDLDVPMHNLFDFSAMLPIVSDSTIEYLRRRYLNKIIYAGRQFSGTCVRQDGTFSQMGVTGTLRVAQVFRVLGAAKISLDGTNSEPSSFQSLDPVVIGFATPMKNKVTFISGSGASINRDPGKCAAYYALAADPFQMERLLSLQPQVDPNWPAPFRSAIAKGTVVLGMTRPMVSASIGYPTMFATVAELEKMDLWQYDAAAPFSSAVHFKNGVVVKYDPPGNVP